MPPQSTEPVNTNPAQPQMSSNSGMAILAYLGILIVIPFLTDAKNDPFVKFHLKQGLTLLVSFFVGFIINVVPFLGWIAGLLLFFFNIIMVIIGIVNVVSKKQSELPIIGKFAKNFNF